MQSPLRFFALLVSLFSVVSTTAQSAESCTSDGDPQQLFQPVGDQRLGDWAEEVTDLQALQINPQVFDYLHTYKFNELAFELPIAEDQAVAFEAELFVPWKGEFAYGTTLPDGTFRTIDYTPELLCYRLRSENAHGTLILMSDYVVGTFAYKGRQYEISAVDAGANGEYVIVPTDAGLHPNGFSCGVDELAQHAEVTPMASSQGGGGCVELAIDIDYHTYFEFDEDCPSAIEWALALVAGVNDIYIADLEGLITVQAKYIHVWQEEDPYMAFVEEAGDMLNAVRLEWINNPNLENIDRDLVHLFSRRFDTGTGGIAYLDANCSSNFGTAFSANLTTQTNYNLSNYAWNLDVVAHELGHNFGSPHTHWCGWSVGTIDDCAEAEGDCSNTEQAQVGTIMSYCHVIPGGSKVLEFHPIVIDEALVPDITSFGSCYTTCDDLVTSCLYYGCTDPLACNFELEAAVDDNSCTYGTDCADPSACNYDPESICEGPCSYDTGCTESGACNYNPDVVCDDGSCIWPDGCTDPEACNFNPNATCNDGSCAYFSNFTILGPELVLDSETYVYMYPTNEGSTYDWEIEGGNIIEGQGSSIIVVEWDPNTTNQLCVTEETAEGCISESQCLPVEVLFVGVESNAAELVAFYPNPTTGVFTLVVNEQFVGAPLRIFDSSGRLCYESQLQGEQSMIDISGQADGMYHVVVGVDQPVVLELLKN